VPRAANWLINFGILGLIIASYVANRQGVYQIERLLTGVLVIGMAFTVGYGILKLRQMQTDFALRSPPKESK